MNTKCPKCETEFCCRSVEKTCWCFDIDYMKISDEYDLCLCKNCLMQVKDQADGSTKSF